MRMLRSAVFQALVAGAIAGTIAAPQFDARSKPSVSSAPT
jgi:hypothetical protein